MSNKPLQIAYNFYMAFQNKDATGMITNYHPELEFEDPAFGKLNCAETAAMWQMLLEGATDLEIEFEVLSGTDLMATARWRATYTFSKTNRKVVNIITAKMELKDGLIIRHIDSFDLHKWARQALGLKGTLLGWSSFFKAKLNEQTNRQLQRYMAKNK